MRRILILGVFALTAIVSLAQSHNDVTKFLGIPVNGSKVAMIKALRAKGYVPITTGSDVLTGEFNGIDVEIRVVTNKNKVYRIMVVDKNNISETDIKIRFNMLCRQFNDNAGYLHPSSTNQLIPEDEDISYGMSVDNKRYEADYLQIPESMDSVDTTSPDTIDEISSNSVWFMVNEIYGKYYITMYYDNDYNRANGEDL